MTSEAVSFVVKLLRQRGTLYEDTFWRGNFRRTICKKSLSIFLGSWSVLAFPLRGVSLVNQSDAIKMPDTSKTKSDDELLLLVAASDRSAYRDLVERYIGKLWRLGISVLANETEAEDAVQDVLLTVWVNRQKWQPGTAKFSTWLYRVMLNRCIDIKRSRRATTGTEEIEETMPSEATPAADQLIVAQEDRHQLTDLIGRLPEQQRLALLLFYYEELDVVQIAERLDTTEQGARSLLKRGRKALKRMLVEEGNLERMASGLRIESVLR